MVRLVGIEPTTTGLEGRCSIQLSYRRSQGNTSQRQRFAQARRRLKNRAALF